MVDDEDVDGGFDSDELEPELLLDAGEQAWRRVGVSRVRLVVGVAEAEVVAA